MRKAAARRPFRYARSLYGSSNLGGPGNCGIFTLEEASDNPGSWGAMLDGLVVDPFVSVADGGDMLFVNSGYGLPEWLRKSDETTEEKATEDFSQRRVPVDVKYKSEGQNFVRGDSLG
jgi:hypothetical protein